MAVSAILRSGLSSAAHLLLPWGLRLFGSDSALAEYGIVSGMAIPVVLYPMALVNAFAQLNTVDVATRISAGESREALRYRIGNGIVFALIYGVGCSAILKAFSYRIAEGIFSTVTAGEFISVLSGYAALAYLDHVADSALKGLDQQSYVMGVNIADSAIGLLLTVILVPRFGIYGYVLSLYICEFINCTLSLGRIIYLLGWLPRLGFALYIPPIIATVSMYLLTLIGIEACPTVPAMILSSTVYFSAVFLAVNLFQMSRHSEKTIRNNVYNTE